jgi:hypothetical protein
MGFLYLYDGAGCLGPRDRVVAGSYAGRTNWQSRRYGWGSSAARGARLGEPFSMRPTTTGLCCRSTTSTSVQAAKTIWSSTRNEWRECRSAETTGGLRLIINSLRKEIPRSGVPATKTPASSRSPTLSDYLFCADPKAINGPHMSSLEVGVAYWFQTGDSGYRSGSVSRSGSTPCGIKL